MHQSAEKVCKNQQTNDANLLHLIDEWALMRPRLTADVLIFLTEVNIVVPKKCKQGHGKSVNRHPSVRSGIHLSSKCRLRTNFYNKNCNKSKSPTADCEVLKFKTTWLCSMGLFGQVVRRNNRSFKEAGGLHIYICKWDDFRNSGKDVQHYVCGLKIVPEKVDKNSYCHHWETYLAFYSLLV